MVDVRDQYFNRVYLQISKLLVGTPDHIVVNRKGDKMHELIDYSFCIYKPHNCFATCRKMSMEYLEGELDFYMSGSPFLADIEKHSKFWRSVSDDDRTINSNYGKLLLFDRNVNNYTQFEYAKNMLIRNEDSKKAVMVVYSPDNGRVSNDNPCTMYLQYFIRDNKLGLYVKMRSSDIWFGLPYDVPFFVLLLYKMWRELKAEYYDELELGTYNHQSGSLHLYERNRDSLMSAIAEMNHLDMTSDQVELFNCYIARMIP